MKFFFVVSIMFVLTNYYNTFAQSIYEPVYNQEIYNFINTQSIKENIKIFDDIRPITRLEIAKKLMFIDSSKIYLTAIEEEKLNFYKREYAFEIKFLSGDFSEINEFFKFGKTDRFNLFKYHSNIFDIKIDPVVMLQYDYANKNYRQFGGIDIRGRISNFLGYYFNYRDNTERGDNLDINKNFSSQTGIIISKSKSNKVEYSETRGGLTFGWDWGEFTMAKDFLNIGSSYQSQVIFSSKAPSLPYIRLDVHPVKWFRYNFIHAWLNSNLIDSTSIRFTGVTSTFENRSKTFSRRQKYYVGHSLSFQPFDNWWLTFGESIIYGDQLEYIYFLPVFFRLADHYNSKSGADSGDNAQLFFNTSYTWPKIKSKLYFSFFIDEMSIAELFSSTGTNAQVFARTIGGRFTNPFLDDNFLTLEYNAIKPYAYMNADPIQYYSSSEYQLGHWIGSNSVQIYADMTQYFARMITLHTFINYVIKGEKESIDDYYSQVTSTYSLLSGKNSYFSQFGINLSYLPLNNLKIEFNYSYIFQATKRFKDEYNQKVGSSLITSISYGI